MNEAPPAAVETAWRMWLAAGAILAGVIGLGHHLTSGAASRQAAASSIAELEADIKRATDLTVEFESQTKALEQKKADAQQQVTAVSKSFQEAKALETQALNAQRENLDRRWSTAVDELQRRVKAASLQWEGGQ